MPVETEILMYDEDFTACMVLPYTGIEISEIKNTFVNDNQYATYKTEELIPYKTINGRDFTKEEWEAYEKEEYRKYIEKKNN